MTMSMTLSMTMSMSNEHYLSPEQVCWSSPASILETSFAPVHFNHLFL